VSEGREARNGQETTAIKLLRASLKGSISLEKEITDQAAGGEAAAKAKKRISGRVKLHGLHDAHRARDEATKGNEIQEALRCGIVFGSSGGLCLCSGVRVCHI